MSRFDYVAYDDVAKEKQAKLKVAAQRVEAAVCALQEAAVQMDVLIVELLPAGGTGSHIQEARESLANVLPEEPIYHLEVSYMWCGKAIRDDQIQRNGDAPLEEGRSNS